MQQNTSARSSKSTCTRKPCGSPQDRLRWRESCQQCLCTHQSGKATVNAVYQSKATATARSGSKDHLCRAGLEKNWEICKLLLTKQRHKELTAASANSVRCDNLASLSFKLNFVAFEGATADGYGRCSKLRTAFLAFAAQLQPACCLLGLRL